MTASTAAPTRAAATWLADFGAALARNDVEATVALFEAEGFWRDLVAFTWNIRTQEGAGAIRAMLAARLADTQPSNFALEGEASEADGVTEAWFTFETRVARGRGHLRLRGGKAWTLLTTMTELKGFEEKTGANRIKGAEHGVHKGRQSWLEKREEEARKLGYTEQPEVVIVGGGQGGIALGARLRRLGVPTIIIERNARAGDSWRNRYKSLCLHDPVWYDHLPYMPFPDDWPVFAPKDKVGDWLEMYTKVMELNYWSSTTAKKARFDEATQRWEVRVEREGKEVVLRPKQLVFALGVSGYPNVPVLAGAENFQGDQHHSSKHPGPEAYAGKKCVVLGSNNSAHDICAALWEHGADVTMIQRSSTHIAPSDSLMELALGGLYSEQAVKSGIDHHKADLIFASVPYQVMHTFHIPVYDEMKKRDADLYARLEKAGFLLDFGADGSGLFMKYLRRGSGYYIDVGASELVANGSVKLRSGVNIERVNERSVTLTDGSELPADLLVYATGYGSMNGWLADLISPEVADRVGKCWGLGSDTPKDPGPWEGELRNMWKPTQVPNLWIHGGNLHQSRHYSQFLALQLKARAEGLDTPVYELAPSHHRR
ncbi:MULTISPECIES: NAD(P)/FAD-dependent oxidoreductase [unclassified Variovorax]|jgi:putative flavoprotein involved in K+ transport|uniref:NAD(P)/FAD-dependent oxidoreductase n=1 Tax=unclassified Variovorax TaxID=663243 RepID=UPI0008DF4921|nr:MULTISPECIES: NAD(P)/FAD-dependent oxidoreductase [unclassified Variovorax]TAJ57113.1 MAG: NAD(P)/FAD-dependent oxidoreductase [Variovorax sp.]SFO60947.1 putative flavoprotein involved in K+ transport [Variovorax sp. PDC80]